VPARTGRAVQGDGQKCIWLGECEPYRQRLIDNLDGVPISASFPTRVVTWVLLLTAQKREFDGFCIAGRSIMKLDAIAQLEDVDLVALDNPAFAKGLVQR